MSEDKTGGPAFPTKGGMLFYAPEDLKGEVDKVAEQIAANYGGMTLLDYFAGQVIGPLAASALTSGKHAEANFLECPEMAYTIARAMIAARKKL